MLFKINNTARIVRDIEVRYTQSGVAVASSALVKSKKWKDKNTGELMEDPCFIDFVAFGNTAEYINQYFGKGDIIEFEGELIQDKWEDNDGNKRSKHQIRVNAVDFGPCKKGEGSGGYTPKDPAERGTPAGGYNDNSAGNPNYNKPSSEPKATPQLPEIDVNEEEIPF